MTSLEDRARAPVLTDPFCPNLSVPSTSSHMLDFLLEVARTLLLNQVEDTLAERQPTTHAEVSFALFSAQILLANSDYTSFLRSLGLSVVHRFASVVDDIILRTPAEIEASEDSSVGTCFRKHHLPCGLPIYTNIFLSRTLSYLLPQICRSTNRGDMTCPLKRLYVFFKNLKKLIYDSPPPPLCFLAIVAADMSFKNPLFAQSYFYCLFIQHWLIPILLINRQISAADAAQAVFLSCSIFPIDQTTSVEHRSVRMSIIKLLDKVFKACSSNITTGLAYNDKLFPPIGISECPGVPLIKQACYTAKLLRDIIPDPSLSHALLTAYEDFAHIPTEFEADASYTVPHSMQILTIFRCICLSLELEKAVQKTCS